MSRKPRISTSVDRPVYDQFVAMAVSQGKSVSAMTHQLVTLYVEGRLVPDTASRRPNATRGEREGSPAAERAVDGVHTTLLKEIASAMPPLTKGRRLRFYHLTRLTYLMAYAFIKVSDELASDPKLDQRVKDVTTDFMKAFGNDAPKSLRTVDRENP